MPKGAIYVGRPTKWGNPYHLGDLGSADGELSMSDVLRKYRERVQYYYGDEVLELRGKDLACWCPLDQPCHADILLELANQ